jgi:hypothetical protein
VSVFGRQRPALQNNLFKGGGVSYGRSRRTGQLSADLLQNPQREDYIAFLWDAFETNYTHGKYQFIFLA